MKVLHIGLAWIAVSDLDKSVEFYRDTIGMDLGELNEMFGWAELTGHEGGARLGLGAGPDENVQPGQNAVVTLTVADIEAARTEMEEKGVELIGEIMDVPGHVRLQMIKDPDGNKMHLVERL